MHYAPVHSKELPHSSNYEHAELHLATEHSGGDHGTRLKKSNYRGYPTQYHAARQLYSKHHFSQLLRVINTSADFTYPIFEKLDIELYISSLLNRRNIVLELPGGLSLFDLEESFDYSPVYDECLLPVGLHMAVPTGTTGYIPVELPARSRIYLGLSEMRGSSCIVLCDDLNSAELIRTVMGLPVVVSFYAVDLPALAQELRSQHPDKSLYICPRHSPQQTSALERLQAIARTTILKLPRTLQLMTTTYGLADLAQVYGYGVIHLVFAAANYGVEE